MKMNRHFLLIALCACALLAVAVALPAIGGERGYAVQTTLTTNSVAVTNAYAANTAADNLLAQKPIYLALKVTGVTTGATTVTFTRTSGSMSYVFLTGAIASGATTYATNLSAIAPMYFKNGDILSLSYTPIHTNQTGTLEVHYE
jgi:hypothetical protein